MPIHPLKAWPFGEWWMPAASTGASTWGFSESVVFHVVVWVSFCVVVGLFFVLLCFS